MEYFDSRDEPLLTFDLYETFTSILIRCDMLDQLCNGSRHSIAVEQGRIDLIFLFESIEYRPVFLNRWSAKCITVLYFNYKMQDVKDFSIN